MLNELRVLVTGGTSGIGAAIAEGMLKAGARVVVNSHEAAIDPELKARLDEQGECTFVSADLSTVDGARGAVDEAAKVLGGLDCLVNNAGTFVDVPFLETEEADFARLVNLNIRGYFFAAQAFARQAGQRNYEASIICTGSSNSLQAEVESVSYDTSKGAVLMMVRSLAVTLAKQGIRVNGVAPGLVQTPINNYGHQHNPELRRLLEAQIPLGRIGDAQDMAGAAVFLASSSAKYITGQMLYVDGGIIAQQMIYDQP